MVEVSEVRVAGQQLAHIDVHACDDDELLTAARDLDALISAAQITHAHVLAELDTRGTTDARHGMRTAAWVAAQSGTARGPIAGRLRVGRAMRQHFDKIDAAVTNGQLTYAHAKALCDTSNPRNVEALANAQSSIVALADGATFEQWKRDVAALAEVADPDGLEPDLGINRLTMPVTLDGTVQLRAALDAANGHAFRTAINAKADELFRRFTRDHELTPAIDIPSRATLRALALIELLRVATGVEPGAGTPPRAEVTLVLHDGHTTDAVGNPMPRAAAEVWGCDPEVWAVVMNEMGIPVDVGHTNRLATVAQRHAITIRDGGCTFPGCDAPIEWCDLHHVQHWQLGGTTDLANLIALCRHHHGITHRTGWALRLDDRQHPTWTTPDGATFTGQRHHRRTIDTGAEP